MLKITTDILIPLTEVEIKAIRSQGAGGQNVNKVASAIHLRFDVNKSSLPDDYKERLLSFQDDRLTKDGVIIIKAQRFRTQQQNKDDAFARLRSFIKKATLVRPPRKATKPTKSSQQKRLDSKKKKGDQKKSRKRSDPSDEY